MKLLENKVITNDPGNLANRMAVFNSNEYVYFEFDTFKNEELSELRDLTLKVADELTNRNFGLYKKILEEQLL